MSRNTFPTTASLCICCAALAAPAVADTIELEFVTFDAAGMVEQDVFVAADDGVRRIPASEVDAQKGTMLYATTASPPFQPMKLDPTETYPKGQELGMTLGQWLAASGTGSYACNDGTATITAEMDGLVPNAVYTMWNFIDANPPTDPWQGVLLPLGARDGSDAGFETDAAGHGSYKATFAPCPETSGSQTMAGIAVAWHADGKTYGASPGKMGVVTFAQLMAEFAAR